MTIVRDLLIAFMVVFASAFFNATMDTIEHHFNDSVFSKIENESTYEFFKSHWTNKYEKNEDGTLKVDEDGNYIRKYFMGIKFPLFKHPAFFDAWHLSKVIFVGLFIMYGLVLYYQRRRVVFYWKRKTDWLIAIGLLFLFGIAWNLSFNLFYDSILLL